GVHREDRTRARPVEQDDGVVGGEGRGIVDARRDDHAGAAHLFRRMAGSRSKGDDYVSATVTDRTAVARQAMPSREDPVGSDQSGGAALPSVADIVEED